MYEYNTFISLGPGCPNCLFYELGSASGCTYIFCFSYQHREQVTVLSKLVGPGCTILLSYWALDVPIVYFISWVPDSQGTSYCIFLPNSDTAEVVLPRLQGSELLRKWDTLIRISKTDVTK